MMETDMQKVGGTYARYLQHYKLLGEEGLKVPHLKRRITKYLRKKNSLEKRKKKNEDKNTE